MTSIKQIVGAFALILATLTPCLNASDQRRVGLIFDEIPVAPMRVESDIIAELAEEIAAELDISLTLLAPIESGIVDRSGAKVDLDAFDALWIFQGDVIVQNSALFNENVKAALNGFTNGKSERGVLLTGGAVALLNSLGYEGNFRIDALTFGEDRNQAGVVPINPDARVFSGLSSDRGIDWITNAAFPAFANFGTDAPNVKTLATSAEGGQPNPLLVGLDGKDGDASRRAKVVAFGWRVSPLFDAAPETYRENFKTFLKNLLVQVGEPIDESEFTAPRYVAPDFDALQRALDYFAEQFDEEEYPQGAEYAARLDALRERSDKLFEQATISDDEKNAIFADFSALQKEALLASPELDFDAFLFVRRDPKQMGLPENYNSNSVIPATGYDDALCRFNFRTGKSNVVYKPEHGEFVGDLELYYDATKVMFSSPDVSAGNRWRLWELQIDPESEETASAAPVVSPLINDADVDNYDGCYLPDDRVVFCSTACQSGVPCINGSGHVCNLYLKERDGAIRQLTLEQDHDWNPVVMNNGRVMYLRWEYVDLPHAFSRIMFHMNPDGTNQSELYGSGSYWPNSVFYARPLPGEGSKFVGVVGGHHEQNRVGDLVIFDPMKGRKEASGAVQRIPGWGKKVEPIACDLPIAQNWPKFLHPFPVSETTFLTSCKRSASAPWEICLVDVFDNIVPIVSEPGVAALEPIPLRETERQPILPDRVDTKSPTADVFIADVYEGEGLKGVPRGEVKALRIFSYEFAYQGMGAEPYSVGLDGPWDPRRIIGTVPVLEDGSASFKIPALVPVAFQPLDKDGKALQIMRSWVTAVPGESVSCVGCHETQNSTSPTNPRAQAAQIKPLDVEPFYGATRGFSFEREIQPILDRYCVDCHQRDGAAIKELIANGVVSEDVLQVEKRAGETFETSRFPDFRKTEPKPALEKGGYIAQASPFSNSYYQLRRFVRTWTKESQMPTHRPYEFHADATDLVQLLTYGQNGRGHYGVELDPESWDKLIAWIDLNAPYNGNWGEILRGNQALVKSQWSRREELRKLYAPSVAPLDDDPNEAIEANPLPSSKERVRVSYKRNADLAMSTEPREASKKDGEITRVALDENVSLELVTIPGANFSVGRFEVTNEQFRAFEPNFDAGIEYGDFIQFSPGERGWLLSRKNQPVARVTWNDAQKFCEWLSEKTGDEYRLPTREEQRFFASAGSAGNFWFDGADYSSFENLADSTHALISPFGWTGRVDTLPAWRPVDWKVDDHSRVSAPVGSYAPNPLGLYDVQGNVAEWTSSELVETRAVVDASGVTISESETLKKIVGGGSWITPARRATLDSIRAYPPQYNLRDVGFRVLRVEK